MQIPSERPIERACRIVGSQKNLAQMLGVRQPSISEWARRAVPLERCSAIEGATDGRVRCEELRTDVEWIRDANGQVTGYVVPVESLAKAG